MENQKNEPRKQHFRTIADAVWDCELIGGSAKLVALRLLEHWPQIWPSHAFLAKKCGLSVRTIGNAVRELEKSQVIRCERRGAKTAEYHFVNVSIPPLGVPQILPNNGGNDDLQILPVRSAESAGLDLQRLPTKGSNLKDPNKRGGSRGRARAAAPRKPAPPAVLASPKVPEPKLWKSFHGWEMPPEFRAECISRGISAERFDFRLQILRNKPLKDGPVWKLEIVVLEALEWWLQWEAQDSKPNCSAVAAPQIDFPFELVKRAGGWVPKPPQLEYARLKALEPARAYASYVRAGKAENKSAEENDRDFQKALEHLVRKRDKSPVQHQQVAA